MERCPVCRARRSDNNPVCYRCGSDLAIPLKVAAEAAACERQAVRYLAQGDRYAAQLALQQALARKRTPLARALLGWLERLPA